MGSKGSATQNQSQNSVSSYTPNAQAAGYITNAIDRAQTAASNPFSIPQAPVAGFSPDQIQAFQQYRDAQGAAQPYYDKAASYFSPQGTQDFYNPYAANVMANMQDVFGQQQSQNTGKLVQAAGGVGADRIAVGEAELSKQQGLVAGQTMADLWQRAASQAQSAGQGQMALGNAAQTSRLQGAGALYGAGQQQQNLSQAEMNSPYQQQIAMAAFPYQQAQFLAGVTGSLAPGLGGTTTGTSNNTGASQGPQPSIWSQLLGAGTAAAGLYGGWNAKSGGSNAGAGDGSWYGPSSVGGAPLSGYAEGGGVSEPEASPYGAPIDISSQSIVPQTQLQAIKPTIPQIAPMQQMQQQKQEGGGNDFLKTAMDVGKIAMMFINRGGRVNPYAEGGAVDEEPFRMPGQAAMDAWRRGVAEDMGAGTVATPYDSAPPVLPKEITGPVATAGIAMPYADPGAPAAPSVPLPRRRPAEPRIYSGNEPTPMEDMTWQQGGPRGAPSEANASAPPPDAQGVNPFSQEAPARREPGFSDSPWAALTAAGLGMMAGTSPYAGVNIGQGGMQGLKALDAQREAAQKDLTADQAARRLAMEAKHHEDQYTRQTVGQKQAQAIADRPYKELTEFQKRSLDSENYSAAGTIQTKDGLHPALFDKKSGKVIDGITGNPPEKTDHVIPKGASRNSAEEINHVVESIISGNSPPTLTGLYGDSIHVRAGLQARGFNLAKAQQEQDAAKKLTASVNAPRMVAYVGLNKSVDRTIDEVKALATQMEQGGIPMLNKLQLQRYINTQGNSPQGQLATRYMTAVNTLKEEFANLANGGYAPTESAWKLANEQIRGEFGTKQMHANLDEVQRLIRYRLQAVPGLAALGPDAPNRYIKPAAAAPDAGGHGSGTPDPKKGASAAASRFQELLKTKTEEEAYAILKEEGYHSGQ